MITTNNNFQNNFQVDKHGDKQDVASEFWFSHPFSVYRKKTGHLKLAQSIWEKLTSQQKQEMLSMPNFDPDIFYEITGINVKQEEPTFLEDEEIIQFEKDLKKLRKTALTNSLDL